MRSKGLRVPVRNEQGKIEMQFDMETATRLDDQNVEMNIVTIQTYNQQTGKEDAKIDLQTSMMNLDTNIITTKEPVRITQRRFRAHSRRRRIQFKNPPGKGDRKRPPGDLQSG